MQFHRNRRLIMIILMVAIFPILFAAADAAANSKADELKRKIADIGLLKQQLVDRQKQAETVLADLVSQQDALVAEVRLLQKSLNFDSYQQARKYERIYFNVELLRSIMAYRQAFSDKIRLYQTGQDKLTYLQQLADDDIKMIATLNDFEIDALTTQISLMVNRYLSEAHIIQIDPEKVPLSSAENVWSVISKSRF